MAAKIADLKKRITFQALTRTADGQGGWTESWADFASVWASLDPVSAAERFYSQRVEMNVSHKITIRKMDGLTPEMRIVFGTRIFQIHGIYLDKEELWFINILAEENVGS